MTYQSALLKIAVKLGMSETLPWQFEFHKKILQMKNLNTPKFYQNKGIFDAFY